MDLDANLLVHLIELALPQAKVSVTDVRGDGEHFLTTVTAPSFRAISRLDQHRLVYKALEGYHAVLDRITIRTAPRL